MVLRYPFALRRATEIAGDVITGKLRNISRLAGKLALFEHSGQGFHPPQGVHSGVERARGRCGGESGVEVGEGVALDLAVGFFSGAELGDGAHFA